MMEANPNRKSLKFILLINTNAKFYDFSTGVPSSDNKPMLSDRSKSVPVSLGHSGKFIFQNLTNIIQF